MSPFADALADARTHEDAIMAIALAYFRQNDATDSEAGFLTDSIYEALWVVEQERKAGRS